MSKLDEIKQALEAATPGDWYRGHSSIGARVDLETSLPYSSVSVVAPCRGAPVCVCTDLGIEDDTIIDANAHLIANAPTWLAELVKVAEAAGHVLAWGDDEIRDELFDGDCIGRRDWVRDFSDLRKALEAFK